MNKAVKCSLCGRKSSTIAGICVNCLEKAEIDPKKRAELRRLSNILLITDSESNVKELLRSITEIAEDLQRSGEDGKEKKTKGAAVSKG